MSMHAIFLHKFERKRRERELVNEDIPLRGKLIQHRLLIIKHKLTHLLPRPADVTLFLGILVNLLSAIVQQASRASKTEIGWLLIGYFMGVCPTWV